MYSMFFILCFCFQERKCLMEEPRFHFDKSLISKLLDFNHNSLLRILDGSLATERNNHIVGIMDMIIFTVRCRSLYTNVKCDTETKAWKLQLVPF